MARGRMLATTIATDKALNSISTEAELLYLKTVPHLDRDGLIVGDNDLLFAKIAPRRPSLIDHIESAVCEWVEAGLVTRYEWKDGQALYFHGFRKNNRITYSREAPSTYPPPPGYVRTDAGLMPAADTSTSSFGRDLLTTNSRSSHDQNTLNGEESNGEERRGEVATSSPAWSAFTKARGVNLSRMDSEQVQELEDLYGSEAVAQAVEYCNAHKNKAWLGLNYIIATLRGWQGDGTLGMHTIPSSGNNGSQAAPEPAFTRDNIVTGQREVWQSIAGMDTKLKEFPIPEAGS